MTNLTPDRILDVRALPGTRETIAYKDGGLFPVLALSNDGTVVAALRGGAAATTDAKDASKSCAPSMTA